MADDTVHIWCREGERLAKIEENAAVAAQKIAIVEERQNRMHDDMVCLTAALRENTSEIAKLTQWTTKRGAFFAGAVFVLTAIGSIAVAMLGYLKDWFAG